MIVPKTLLAVVACSFLINSYTQSSLPRSTPEAEGVSSKNIITFLDSVNASKNEFHSFMLLRHGKVVAEGWWNPYRADLKHTMYSCSKSFTATAVGFAVSEKKITVNDKVVSFFPDQLPDTVSANLSQLTVRDLLTMSAGQEPDPIFSVTPSDDWVKNFLAVPIVNKPGSKFLYNSMATYMLSAIVQKVTGEKVLDYLKPRLFETLGVTGIDWETDSKGINTGGWGLRLKTEDMAKFGQLFLQKGKWNGKQIIPATWIEEASTVKIIQHPEYSQAKKDSSDWEQGYCYQMWRCRHNAFRGDGAFGQYIIVLPDEDAVIAITSETANMQDELNLVWKLLLPAFHKERLPADRASLAALNNKIESLAVTQPQSNASAANNLSGKTFVLETNDKHINSISFHQTNNTYTLDIKSDTAEYDLDFAAGKWAADETTMHGPNLIAKAQNNLNGLPPFKTAGEYVWKDNNTLQLVLRYIESPHTQFINCTFNGDAVKIEFAGSYNYMNDPIVISGTLKK